MSEKSFQGEYGNFQIAIKKIEVTPERTRPRIPTSWNKFREEDFFCARKKAKPLPNPRFPKRNAKVLTKVKSTNIPTPLGPSHRALMTPPRKPIPSKQKRITKVLILSLVNGIF